MHATLLRERLLGPAALFVLVVFFHWKLVLTNQYTWMENPDISNLEPVPDLGSCGPVEEDVQMPLHQPNYVRMTANLQCRGMVILTDSWCPGWRAKVDGKAAESTKLWRRARGGG